MLSPPEPAALSFAVPGVLLLCLLSTLVFKEVPLAGSWDFVFVPLIPGSFSSSSERKRLPFLLPADVESRVAVAPLSVLFPGRDGASAPSGGAGRVLAVRAAQGSATPCQSFTCHNYKLRAALKGSP